ncbi:ABC transporter ATP-binding protein [Bradyrhizobium sp. Ash2021]|uniref:ABC transporter ATP-binding protein n=1 Tax=Bradyrhizobium sp. Ash2021 TaxID=2954771 RepID=UPI0028169334|nr:ABC transporter ATP-binding protein [Bradyrhizobium sp. Ash2021]WMT76423.1 ABC transporter ATP-binding protein [Bradyrhizobium sp. Ash2021]WMT76437.1 ABC transporter ATP-binding protein [Bradyrhizobium sp. Ash2021]
MSDMADLLALDRLGHSFGGFAVLRSVTFSVPVGDIVGLIGPNGSGKTTLFNIVSGYIAHRHGSVLYGKRDLSGTSIQERSKAGMVRTFQTPKVFEQMTVIENIMVGACKITRSGMIEDLLRLPRSRSDLRHLRERAEEICVKFDLADVRNQLSRTLPAGQRRILEIARAVIGQPKLLMLDEPSSGLNADEIANLRRWIELLNAEGTSILLVSHDMELMGVADRVHVLYFGEIIASGDMGEIQRNAKVREVYLGT